MQDSHPLIGVRKAQDRSRVVQLTATTLRQVRQAVRKPCSLCIETLLPVLFVLLFAWLSTLTHNDHYPSEVFEKNPPADLVQTLQNAACMDTARLNVSDPTTPYLQALLPTCDSTILDAAVCGGQMGLLSNNALCYSTTRVQGLKWFTEPKNITMIPSIDYIMLAHQIAVAAFGPISGKLISNQASNSILGQGRIYIAPANSPDAVALEAKLRASAGAKLWATAWFGGFLESEAAAFSYLSSNEGAGRAVALITVNSFKSDNVNVALAFNKSNIVWPTINTDRFSGGAGWGYKNYFGSGFISLEKAILMEFNALSGADSYQNDVAMGPMPFPDYILNNFLTIAGTMAPLGLCLGYLYAVSQIAKRLVEEKELRLREAMAAMGMSKTLILVSWMLFFFLLNFVTATLCTIILKASFVSHSDGSVIWLLMMLFSMTTSSMGGLISSFFSKSRTASIATPILFFAFSIPSFALGDNATAGELKPLSLLSPTAFATALKLVFQYELNTGIGWNDLNNPNDDVTLGFCLFIMIFDLIAYLSLTWYLDNVLAGEWGVRQHPCFCFINCFNGCKSKRYNEENLITPGMDQPVNAPRTLSGVSEQYPVNTGNSATTTPAVVFENVSKTFGSGADLRRAVTNFNLKIFSGMVTAVLGHNGAGKTTLFNMLTGMLPVSSGDCYIYGASITTDRDEARAHIGLCPQHNILWDDLTCFEHLRYFAWIKGTPFGKCAEEAERMLESVDLAEKRNALSASLSGGQKRKLSVAIAFIGGSELVLLDEPTAGMDVHTRRHTWDLIQKMAREEKRTIILTTHFMDEAELLGDRMAMMTAGQLHSYGTTTFLKSRLGEGYTLAIQYASQPTEETRHNVKRLVQTVVPSARDKESRGREQFLVLPMDQVEHFAKLLHTVENNKAQHGIVSVSMTVATIEDVFVKIATEDEAHPDTNAAYGVLAATKDEASDSQRKLALRNASFTRDSVTVTVDDKVSAAAVAAQTVADVRVERPGFVKQLGGLLKKRLNIARRDTRAMVLQLVLPLVCILLAMALATLGAPDTHDTLMDVHALPDPQSAVTSACDVNFVKALTSLNLQVSSPPGNPATTTIDLVNYLLANADKHGKIGRNIAYQCSTGADPAIMFTNSTGYLHAAPYGIAAYYNSVVRTKVPTATVSIYNGPLPLTPHETQGIKAITNAVMALMITVPFSFIPSTFTGFIVKERESKAKLLQFVSGVGYGAYWASNAIFDLLSFLITQMLAIIIFLAFGRSEYIGTGEAFIATFVLFLMYAAAAIPTAYVMSLAFRNHSTAQNAVLGIFFLAGFGLTLTGYLLKALDGPSFLIYIFRLFPPECLGEGLMAIANAPAAAQAGQPVSLWAMDQAGWPLLYLGLMCLVMSCIILFVDHPERAKRQQMLTYSAYQTAPVPAGEPIDVAAERRAVEASNDAILRVVGLRKEYAAPSGSLSSVNVAVRNLTFQVPKGEIFGLLGTNGAGKTTSMNVITGECLPTMGHAYVAGADVVEQAGDARQLIGYCPQFDALHDLMTVDEHLALYASLRGVQNSDRVSDALCTALGLTEYRRNKSQSLSGGNKRKLSVAIALLGAPKLLLLDEPTAGMDPVARRSMCDVVAAISMHCAVVLTTHHLEEVEALADRAAIMVGGAMQCLGTLEHLKQTLGAGYQVSIRLKDEIRAQACIDRMTREYPNQCKLLEQHLTKLNFNIKQGGRASIANLFEFLYRLKVESNDLGVVDYTVAQSSVEEVFLAVAGGTANEAVANADDVEAASFVVRQSSTHLEDEKRVSRAAAEA